jgi:hypothetical protein
MPIQKSLNAFKQEKLNCAQSVFRGFQEKKGIQDDFVHAAKVLGGGRAPEGRCGALHAALELTVCSVAKDRLTHVFLEKAGSDKCREIKKFGKLTCEECVVLAAEELVKASGPVD